MGDSLHWGAEPYERPPVSERERLIRDGVWRENLDGIGAFRRHVLLRAPFTFSLETYRMTFGEWPSCPWKPRDYTVRVSMEGGEVLWEESVANADP